jgi:alpha,alpha-trehalase
MPAHRRTMRATAALWLLCAAWVAQAATNALPPTPAQQFEELFVRVQSEALFADSKTFADALPRSMPEAILAEYRARPPAYRAALAAFVDAHFRLPQDAATPKATTIALPLREHIAALWPQLIRPPVQPLAYSSELAFGRAHVVPGGRFREIYYWDSYFSLLGLMRDGHADIVEDMASGFAGLIARYGHVPNGTRSYYLSRSQPPFFYRIVGLLAADDPALAYARFLPALLAEHAYWMDAANDLKPGAASGHVVDLGGGLRLNRYWDHLDTPRDESYREDVALAQRSGRTPAEVYRDIRSAAESGWDFSSRWLADGRRLETIETSAILPVDLNSLLYGLERAIEQGCARLHDETCVRDYAQRASQRRAAMDRLLWNAQAGAYFDYQWRRGRSTQRLSAATLYPLFTGAASAEQAQAIARCVRAQLLAKGGIATTMVRSGQQWDRPNGWAPLQWIAVSGLRAYGHENLARDIAQRWLRTVQSSYRAERKLVEKYDVETGAPGGGGEYPLQDGFGWTNGVTRALMDVQLKENGDAGER